MATMTLEAHLAAPVTIDVCATCQAFWFDKYESLRLSPGSTLKLMKFIGEHSLSGKASVSEVLRCPRCANRLSLTHDLQGGTRFSYWRCGQHGRFIGFFDFLREKKFIRALSPKQIAELRENVQTLNCSNCGAAIDLTTASTCEHCGSPVSMLDMKQPQEMLNELQHAAVPKAIRPTLRLELVRAKRDVERLFGPVDPSTDLWSNVSSSGLVETGLGALVQWLTKSGV
jgi:hypothetical protein